MFQLMNTLSNWLQGELEKREWSQADLARRAGISRASVSDILAGKRGIGKEIDRRAAALKDTIAQSAKVQAARQTFAASLEQAREILQDLPEWMLSDDPKIVNGLLSRLILRMTIHPDGSVKVTLRG